MNLAEDARSEACTDEIVALLMRVSARNDGALYSHARRAGVWAQEIAEHLPFAPDATLMRRCGTLADLDPAVVAQIPELGPRCARILAAFQEVAIFGNDSDDEMVAVRIIQIARCFDEFLFPGYGAALGPQEALELLRRTFPRNGDIIDALSTGFRSASRVAEWRNAEPICALRIREVAVDIVPAALIDD